MYPDLPIQQLLRRKDTRFQFGFARQAKELVAARDEFLFTASRDGLRVLGRNEGALRVPAEVLRDVYGPKLDVLPPDVRFTQTQEPVMHVRVSVESRLLDAVKDVLDERGAAASDGRARHWIVLSHYAPRNRTPGGDAA